MRALMCFLQVLGLFSLSMMSTAAIVGAGIFVLTGVVAKQAG
jgi:amino acid transporter